MSLISRRIQFSMEVNTGSHLISQDNQNYTANKEQLCSYLHQVLLHVVGHELYNFFLAVKLLRQRARRESEVLAVG